MFNNNNEEDRGQVGIGTLIVFIALVLVAAIAAGVLINTADLLQSQAEQTGEESTDQVVNTIQVDSVTGLDNEDNDDVDQMDFVIANGPGSEAIDVTSIEIQVLSDTQNEILDYDGTGTDGAEFSATAIDGGDETTLDSGERVEVSIDTEDETTGGAGDVDALNPGESAQVTFTTAGGSQTVEEIQIPDILDTPEDL